MGRQKLRTALKGLFLSIALLSCTTLAYAGPDSFNVQGRLVDSAGNPVSGTQSVVFKIQQVPATGSAVDLWTDTQTVTFQNGIYSVSLGSATNPLATGNVSIFAGNDPFQLVITIGGTTFPAIPIRQTPLAIRAEMLGSKRADEYLTKPTISGTNGQVLSLSGGNYVWTSMPDSVKKSDFGGKGYLLVGDGSGGCLSIAPGTAGQVLTSNGSFVGWKTLQPTIPADLLSADGSLMVRAGGANKELPVGNNGEYLCVQNGFPFWSALPNYLSQSVFTGTHAIVTRGPAGPVVVPAPTGGPQMFTFNGNNFEFTSMASYLQHSDFPTDGSILVGMSNGAKPIKAGPANSIFCMDSSGQYPKWATANYLTIPSHAGQNGQVLTFVNGKSVWENPAPAVIPAKVYAHYELLQNAWGILRWTQKPSTTNDFSLESYTHNNNTTTAAAIRFKTKGTYLVTVQFIVNPNYNWNEILLFPVSTVSTHSNGAILGTKTTTDGSCNIAISQSASGIISVSDVSGNNSVFRMVSNGWGGPDVHTNKAFGKIIIIKID